MTAMDISEALEFAAATHNGVLVTQKRDGRPQLSNISHVVIDGVVKISITAGRAKYNNLLRNAHASLRGRTAELLSVATTTMDPGVDELVEVYRAILGEHPDWDDYRRAMVADERVVVRVKPTHAYGMLGG